MTATVAHNAAAGPSSAGPLPPAAPPSAPLQVLKRVKVHYAVSASRQPGASAVPYVQRSPRPLVVTILPARRAHDVDAPLFAEVSLKSCLNAIVNTRPDLLLDPRADYSISAIDAQESHHARLALAKRERKRKRSQLAAGSSYVSASSPVDLSEPPSSPEKEPSSRRGPMADVFEGKGMMRWVLAERGEGSSFVVGRVVDDQLEVDISFTQHDACSQSDFVRALSSLANPPPTPVGPKQRMPASPSASDFVARLVSQAAARPMLGLPPIDPSRPMSAELALAHKILPSLVATATANPASSAELMPAICTLVQSVVTSNATESTTSPVKAHARSMPAPPPKAPAAPSSSAPMSDPAVIRKRKAQPVRAPASSGLGIGIDLTSQDDGALEAGKPLSKRQRIDRRCANCHTFDSPKGWLKLKRRSRNGDAPVRRLCSPCGYYFNEHREHRPVNEEAASKSREGEWAVPSAAKTSPVRQPKSRAVVIATAATSPIRHAAPSRPFPTPGNKTPSFVHHDTPNTALNRILGIMGSGGPAADPPSMLAESGSFEERLRMADRAPMMHAAPRAISSSSVIPSSAPEDVFPRPSALASDTDYATSPRPTSPSPSGKRKRAKLVPSALARPPPPTLTWTAPSSTPAAIDSSSTTPEDSAGFTPSMLGASPNIGSSPPTGASKASSAFPALFEPRPSQRSVLGADFAAFERAVSGGSTVDGDQDDVTFGDLISEATALAQAGGDDRSAQALKDLFTLVGPSPAVDAMADDMFSQFLHGSQESQPATTADRSA